MIDDREAWLRLVSAPGVGPVGQRRLLKAFGDVSGAVSQSADSLARVLGPRAASAFHSDEARSSFAAARSWLDSGAGTLLSLADGRYPSTLLDLRDPPCALFCRGRIELFERPGFGIVGARGASAAGIRTAEQFGEALSRSGRVIVSGLALGIDAAAHRGGLNGGASTIAVLGTGPDRVYPARNRELALELVDKGLLITEFVPGTAPLAHNFPRRNRLIAALASGVLVVEAAVESGSLITAHLAAELGRDVFAVPGSIHSPVSKGCHRLIKDGAKLVESAEDIFEELRWGSRAEDPRRLAAPGDASGNSEAVLGAMAHDPCSVDQICTRAGLTGEAVLAILLELEISGLIEVRPGGYYQRC